MQIIDGKATAKKIREELAEHIAQSGIVPCLAVILVGDDPASQVYVSFKKKACEKVGIRSIEHRLSANTTQEELRACVSQLNTDPDVDGILVQLPLPSHLDQRSVLEHIDPAKDVDGLTPTSGGRLLAGAACLVPCTPKGIIRLLDEYNIELAGKHAVVLGRSILVGKPIALLLQQRHATVTMCHSRTVDLAHKTQQADIVIAAVGKPHMIGANMLKEGAVVIDVGINRLDDGKLVGDVAFDEMKGTAAYATPVPGGVGPMTIAMLLENTYESACKRKKK